MSYRRNAGLLGAIVVLAVACGGGTATTAPATPKASTAAAATGTPAAASHAAASQAAASHAAASASAAAPSASAAAPSGSAAAPSASTGTGGSAGACKVAVSWNNFQQPRWAAHDKPNIQQTVEAGGGTYTDIDANNSTDTQLSQIQTLIGQDINVLILLAADTKALANSDALANLKAAGIPVIAYDRLLESPDAFYITFDNIAVGKDEADAILKAVPPGTTDKPANYVLIKGAPGDPNATTFLPLGWDQAGLKDAVDAGTIKILNTSGTNWPKDYGTYTDDWATTGSAGKPGAQENMETIIDKAVSDGNNIDAILAENDSTALGVANALVAKSYPTFPPLSGQDGDTPNLNNVALGHQYVDVWKNANELGKAAGTIALQLCQNPDFASIKLPDGLLMPADAPALGLAAKDFVTPGPDGVPDSGDENTVKSIILTPQPVTADNLDLPLAANYLTKDQLCKGVDTTSATAPAACQ